VLAGNNTDLGKQQEVQKHEGMELAHKLGTAFWEVSALKGDSINEMFQRMVFLVLGRAMEANADTPKKSSWEPEPPQKGLWKVLTSAFSSCMGGA
jgi:hypothetical protein